MRTCFQLNKLFHHYLKVFLFFQRYHFHHYSCEMCQSFWIIISFFCHIFRTPFSRLSGIFSFLSAESYILQFSLSLIFSTPLSTYSIWFLSWFYLNDYINFYDGRNFIWRAWGCSSFGVLNVQHLGYPEFHPSYCINQVWCFSPVISALKRWRQKDESSLLSLGI